MATAHEQLVIDLVQDFARGDSASVRGRLSDGLIAHVTEPDGSTREVVGPQAYADAVDWMDPASAGLWMDVPQITTIDGGLVLAMFEVHAARYGRTLHNFSGQLFRFDGDLVDRIWMVEALPKESDEFWAATP